MKDRLKYLRKDLLKITQRELAEKIGVAKPTIEGYEYGRREISSVTLKCICKEFNVNYDWLANGSGEPFATKENEAMAIIDAVMTSDNEFVKNALVKLAGLDKKYWDMIEEIIEELKKE